MNNALVVSGKVYVAWKRKMLHDVGQSGALAREARLRSTLGK